MYDIEEKQDNELYCSECFGSGNICSLEELCPDIECEKCSKKSKCKKCNGRGLEGDAKECNKCSNIGFIKEIHQETIDIPRGVNKTTPIIIPNILFP